MPQGCASLEPTFGQVLDGARCTSVAGKPLVLAALLDLLANTLVNQEGRRARARRAGQRLELRADLPRRDRVTETP